MTQNDPKWPKNDLKWPTITPRWPKNYARIYALFPQIFLMKKRFRKPFSLLECMCDSDLAKFKTELIQF